MKFVADFHVHSHYSMATSGNLTPEWLDFFARVKGIQLIATGDFTHPAWCQEIAEKLEPSGNGLFRLKDKYRIRESWVSDSPVSFILSAEVSSIYQKKGKTRKVHTVLLMPDLESCRKVASLLQKLGYNTRSDGRPITGLDAETIARISLDACADSIVFPAHVWTPWFSALGANSGFDSIEECYGSATDSMYAIETGLSSDSVMNRMCSSLDRFVLLSNFDAHSPGKIGRNATVIDSDIDYYSILNLLKTANHQAFSTIDMYPQEGKYHFAGHRACSVCLDPVEVLSTRGLCPKCGKPVTLGVMDRVAMLADRDEETARNNVDKNNYIIPLREILAQVNGVGESTKKVDTIYKDIIAASHSELDLLLNTELSAVRDIAGPVVAEAIRRMRTGNVHVSEGYDGEYGSVTVFSPGETGESRLHDPGTATPAKHCYFDVKKYREIVINDGNRR